MSAIKIDPEFRALIPPLDQQQLELLHTSLTVDGVRDKLLVWKEKNILIDGHNRWEFCQGKDIQPEPRFEYLSFDDREEVKRFMIRNQLGRRNVTPDEASRLRGLLYESKKKAVGGNRGNQHTPKDQNDTLANTAEAIAKETGVSAPTIKRDAHFVKSLKKLGMTIADMKAAKMTKKDVMIKAFPPKVKKKPTRAKVLAPAEVITPSPAMPEDEPTPEPAVKVDSPDPFLSIVQWLPELSQGQFRELVNIIQTRWIR